MRCVAAGGGGRRETSFRSVSRLMSRDLDKICARPDHRRGDRPARRTLNVRTAPIASPAPRATGATPRARSGPSFGALLPASSSSRSASARCSPRSASLPFSPRAGKSPPRPRTVAMASPGRRPLPLRRAELRGDVAARGRAERQRGGVPPGARPHRVPRGRARSRRTGRSARDPDAEGEFTVLTDPGTGRGARAAALPPRRVGGAVRGEQRAVRRRRRVRLPQHLVRGRRAGRQVPRHRERHAAGLGDDVEGFEGGERHDRRIARDWR